MPKDYTFNGSRLKHARLYRGMSLSELESQTELSKQSLSYYENNVNKPELENLFKISKALGFPYEFFLHEDTNKITTDSTYFRSFLTTKKKDRTAQTIKLEYLSQIYSLLSETVHFPELTIPEIKHLEMLSDTEIEKIALKARDFWGLGLTPIDDLLFLLVSNGVLVTCMDTNSDKIDAFSQKTVVNSKDVYIVVISKDNQTQARANFDMAHELGHILLHPWSEDIESIDSDEFRAREKQANNFAGAFLLPADSFGSEVSAFPTKLDYYKILKQKWNVSIQAMVYRARQLDIISNNQFQYLMRQIVYRKWKIREPYDKLFDLKVNILQQAIDLLIKDNEYAANVIMESLEKKGLPFDLEEFENLLCLKRGTMKFKNNKTDNVVELKNYL